MTHRNQTLQRRLCAFQPTNPMEKKFQQQMLTLLETSQAPFSRNTFEPGHFTASAFVLSPNKRALLLIFHGKLHRWLQPGGHVDPEDKDILSAAKREVLEEVGISELHVVSERPFDLDIHDIPARKEEPAHKHFDVRFLFHAKSEQFHVGSDAKDAQWYPIEEIAAIESDRSVMRAVEKLRTIGHDVRE